MTVVRESEQQNSAYELASFYIKTRLQGGFFIARMVKKLLKLISPL